MGDRVIILSSRPAKIRNIVALDFDKNLTPLKGEMQNHLHLILIQYGRSCKKMNAHELYVLEEKKRRWQIHLAQFGLFILLLVFGREQ